LHVKAQDLSFTDESDGTKKAEFDVMAVGFGDNGIPVDQTSRSYTVSLRKDVYEKFLKEGFVYDFTFPIKKPGAYQLRVAIRDKKTEKVGSANQSVEVPNLKKNRLTLSGVVLENMSFNDWQKFNAGQTPSVETNALNDTSMRQFKRGTVVNYGFTIFNAKIGAARDPSLNAQIRLFRDGKPLFEGKSQPVPTRTRADPTRVGYAASLSLGTVLAPGDYVLQIVITDSLAKEKRNTAIQFVQFEVVD